MKCPYCNGDVEAESQFCIHCGRKVHLHTVEEFTHAEEEAEIASEAPQPEASENNTAPQYSPYTVSVPNRKSSSTGLLIGLIAAVMCAVLFGIFAIVEYQQATTAKEELSAMEAQVDYYSALADEFEEKAWFLDEYVVFVVDDDETYYYHYDSEEFQNAETYRAFNVKAAEAYGYIPSRVH